MFAQRQQSEAERIAFERGLSDDLVAAGVLSFLEQRVSDLEVALNAAARAALVRDDARSGALILEGQLREAKSWLDITKRYLETGSVSVKRPASNT